MKGFKENVLIQFILLIGFVTVFSLFFSDILGGEEKIPLPKSLVFQSQMTISEFGEKNNLPNSVLLKEFQLEGENDFQKKLGDFDNLEEKIDSVRNKLILHREGESKSWIKIAIKFGLWIFIQIIVFNLIRRNKITVKNRKIIYFISLTIFGVILGSDPGPMGTVKDAVALFAVDGVIFPQRLAAMGIFLFMVFIANKFICSWGCQVGTLQDLIFRLNKNNTANKNLIRQYKIPFVLSNTVRIIFFIVFTVIVFMWSTDIIEYIDPFKIFAPMKLEIIGMGFIGLIFIGSIFVYRPWCHLFCPFGLVGWFIEKISVFKICVDYDKCISCEACSKACPSTAMENILKQEKTIPDCFSCGSCIETCPTEAISFKKGKRPVPPKDKFKK
ncbi:MULTISPECIES: 4Fe-4S binding protein [Psychrilyobacter]|uniref:4Fe-4S dicluster domain-containing protein n=1 Tax=Psychrilyobacter piezotolerans TaxID=2293438 RepID=A0ABX9KFE0_9FUSO|nr:MULTISPECIES: 4Fe-4S binding protein [Psychrilyobacter]MCS5421284.1 4Fe-4S binding protein [Psychrilyobacter sp. S5]NDI78147.1 4Fe-4S dicluster domain-containing protein [Psychrilyobacter piezotolerans]RDE60161.1 4Fe-4S dicluster domain-containing protein [Psychrilyobacter sp. S5]REI40343.1 4Fe-4S dicluster domain-containing protein [Psychrilyobacter piezotolerans]